MTLDEAVETLSRHNKWRRGGEGDMLNPVIVGVAIDVILGYIEGIRK